MNIADLNRWVIGKKLPQFGQVNIHVSAREITIVTPYFSQRCFTWQQFILVVAQHFQQFGFLGYKADKPVRKEIRKEKRLEEKKGNCLGTLTYSIFDIYKSTCV